ncbi:MAG: hypothetical protein IT201_01730 [Thermoleophilia bacterium]|nr:hypothetical protein [Thermoleophilia bacterium]
MSSRRDTRRPGRPAYFLLDLPECVRGPAPDREDGLWGRLEIELECLTEIHVGGTAPVVADLDGKQALVQGMTRLPADSGQMPVVPGSSVKGAVRAVVEAITPSCDRLSREKNAACQSSSALCPACAAFGAPGWRATVAFSDLLPVEPAELSVRRIAQRFSHQASRRGRRLYGLEPEEPLPGDAEALECLSAGSRLRGAVLFEGVTEAGAGAVTLALGLPPHGLPLLRLGGGKNRGLAQARVTLTQGAAAQGWASAVRRQSGSIDIGALQGTAFSRWPACRSRLDLIKEHYS